MNQTSPVVSSESIPPSLPSPKALSALYDLLPRKLVRVQLAGTMQATTYTGSSVLPRSRKARGILAYLCLARGKSVSRTRLASLLWDRVPDAQARASLRQALAELTSCWSSVGNLLEINRESVRLHTDSCWIDMLALLDLSQGEFDQPPRELLKAVSGPLLEDLDGISSSCDEWLSTERSHIEDRLRGHFERQLTHLANQKAPPQLRAQAARDLINFDPTHERGWQVLMKALTEMGDRAQAMREFQRCRESLKRILDIEPSAETRSLHDAIRAVSQRPLSVPTPEHGTPEGPSISAKARLKVAVLPFVASGPADETSLAWTLGLDTATALARFRWFDVIAPLALATLRTEQAGWESTLDDLKVDYAIRGTLTTLGDKIRVKVVLLNVHGPAQAVWSDSYELPRDALGEADERVTTRLVARIDPVILFIEGTRPGKREWSDATGLVLKAIPLMYSFERQSYDEAGSILARAAAEAPQHSMVFAWLAFWYLFNVGQGWSNAPQAEYLEAEKLSLKAIDLDPENAEALGIYAHLCSYVHHDFDSAMHYFDRSLLLNPSLAFIWALSAPTSCYIGQPHDALRRLQRYRDLAPFDPYYKLFETIYTVAYTFAEDYENAVLVGRRSVRANPDFINGYKPLLAALGHLGRTSEAAHYRQELLRREPGFSIRNFARKYPFRRKEDQDRYIEGLRKAGVPEE